MASDEKRIRLDENIYMDYNATTPLAPSVINAITDAMTEAWQNPSSPYDGGVKAKTLISESRKNISKMINCEENEIIFMSGGTEANNHVVQSCIDYFKEFNIEGKPHFITSNIEHDSILKVLEYFEEQNLIDVTYVNISKELGHISVESVLQSIRAETVLVTVMMANNETGAIQPIQEICEKIKTLLLPRVKSNLPRVFVHTDAAQAFGKILVDVKELGVDYLTIVGHKFYGPRIGALWVQDRCPLYPMLHGGGQESSKRAGTENTCMIAGLGEAARLVFENINTYRKQLDEIRCYLKEKLVEAFADRIIFNATKCSTLPNTLNISIIGETLTGRTVLKNCCRLQASVGAACHTHMGDKPSKILLAHGITEDLARNAIRLSVGRETTKENVDATVEDLKQAKLS